MKLPSTIASFIKLMYLAVMPIAKPEIKLIPTPSSMMFWVGISIGILWAVSIYFFLNLIPSLVELLFYVGYYRYQGLAEIAKTDYNLVIAGFASIHGMNSTMQFWTRGIKQDQRARQYMVMNDHRVLLWQATFYLCQLGFILAYLQATLFFTGRFSYDFAGDYWWAFLLLIVVMFWSSWNNTIRFHKGKKSVLYGISAALCLAISLILAQFDLRNIPKVDAAFKRSDYLHEYRLDLDQSGQSFKVQKQSWDKRIFLVLKRDESNLEPVIFSQGKIVGLSDLAQEFDEFRVSHSPSTYPYLSASIYADTGIAKNFVEAMVDSFYHFGAKKVYLAVEKDDKMCLGPNSNWRVMASRRRDASTELDGRRNQSSNDKIKVQNLD